MSNLDISPSFLKAVSTYVDLVRDTNIPFQKFSMTLFEKSQEGEVSFKTFQCSSSLRKHLKSGRNCSICLGGLLYGREPEDVSLYVNRGGLFIKVNLG